MRSTGQATQPPRPLPSPPTPELARDPAIEAEIENNYRMAGQLGASGTPLFVIGNQVINSAVGYDALKEAVAKARAAKG